MHGGGVCGSIIANGAVIVGIDDRMVVQGLVRTYSHGTVDYPVCRWARPFIQSLASCKVSAG